MSERSEIEPEEIKSRFERYLNEKHSKAVERFAADYPRRYQFTFDWESFQTCDPRLAQEYRSRSNSIQEHLDQALQFSDAHDAICLPGAWVAPSSPPIETNLHTTKASDIGSIIGCPVRVSDISEETKAVRSGGYRCSACENLERIFTPLGQTREPFQCSECGRKSVKFELDDEFSHFITRRTGTIEDAAHLIYDFEQPTNIQADIIGPIAEKIEQGDWLTAIGRLSADIDSSTNSSPPVVSERLQVVTGEVLSADEIEQRVTISGSHSQAPNTSVSHLSAFETADISLERNHLIGLMNHVQSLFDAYDSKDEMTEEDVKIKAINPLLEILGWDIYAPEVRLEYPVVQYQSQKAVDYVLLIQDEPAVCVEAKSPSKAVGRKGLNQLYDYMRTLDAEWGLLTNGWDYKLVRKGTTTSPNQLADFTVELMPEYNNEISNLIRDNISYSG